MTTNPYTVLGLRKGVSDEEIRRTYHQLIRKWDPETHLQEHIAVQQAYNTLHLAQTRAAVDIDLYTYPPGSYPFTAEERAPTLRAGASELTRRMAAAHHHLLEKRYPEGIEELEAAQALAPDEVRVRGALCLALMRWGWSLAERSRLRDAADMWQRAAALDPDCAAAHHNLALALERLQERGLATRSWHEAIGLWQRDVNDSTAAEMLRTLVERARRRVATLGEEADHIELL